MSMSLFIDGLNVCSRQGRLGVILGVVCEDDDVTTDTLTRIIFEVRSRVRYADGIHI